MIQEILQILVETIAKVFLFDLVCLGGMSILIGSDELEEGNTLTGRKARKQSLKGVILMIFGTALCGAILFFEYRCL